MKLCSIVTPLRAAVLLGLLAGGLAATPARAQMQSREGIALQDQILELRHELDLMRNQAPPYGGSSLGRQPPPPVTGNAGDLLPQLLDRVATLEDQMRDLRGRVEALENTQRQQGADLGKQIGDLQFQLQQMQGGAPPGGAASGSTAGQATTLSPPPGNLGTLPAGSVPPGAPANAAATPRLPLPAGPAASPRRTPELAMQEGNAALARRDYPAAEAAAREVLQGGRTPRSYDAQFLLAQALAGERDWRGAAVAYGDAYQRATTGGHAQDALLGLGNSLTALGDKKSACEALDTLRAQSPTPRPDLREAVLAARVRAGCH